MRVHGTERLSEFCAKHTHAKGWVQAWLADSRSAQWSTPQHIKLRYASTSYLPNNLVIFNVKGNEYRMVVQVAYKSGIVIVKWIGSHADYSKLDWGKIENEAARRKD